MKTLKSVNKVILYSTKKKKTIKKQGKLNVQTLSTESGSLFDINIHSELNTMDKILSSYRIYKNSLKDILRKSEKLNIHLIKDDYYTYINEAWLSSKEKELLHSKKYFTQIDNFRIIQDKVYHELVDMIKMYIKKNPTSKKTKAISAVYNSIYNSDKKTGLKEAHEILLIIESFIKNDDLYGLLGYINKNEIVSWASPITWKVYPDEKRKDYYISHLSMPQLILYDYNYYFIEDYDTPSEKKFKNEVKEKYLKMVSDTFKVVLPHEYQNYNPEDLWNIEKKIITALGCEKYKNDNIDGYNKVSRHDLENKYAFDWGLFAKNIGYSDNKIPSEIIIASINGFSCILELLKKEWNTPEWKIYWLFIFYRQHILMNWDWRSINFKFYRHFLQGQEIITPREIFPVFFVSACFNTFLTEEYILNNNRDKEIEYVRKMGNDIKKIFINKLTRNSWLSSETRDKAILKLNKLKLVIGNPEKLRADPLLDYTRNNPWRNMELLARWRTQKAISLEGTTTTIDIPNVDWASVKMLGSQAYVVNAFYTPTLNSIYIPHAYLQKPFIDLDERGIEYNLAFIGYTIAHEFSHCLDDMGSRFDENGLLHDWWKPIDRKKFKIKIDDVVKQYEEFALRDGLEFDASVGVGEDLADISGISLVEEYLLLFQQGNNDIDIIKKISLEAFYVYIAIQSRQSIKKRALQSQVKVNPHPLEKYRCNCALARLDIFKTLYNVKKGDKMWWNNSDTIW